MPTPSVPPRADRRQFHHYPRIAIEDIPKPWAFPPSLDNPNCRWLQTLKRLYAMPISFPASISPDGGLFLHALTRNVQPRVVIETGTFIGISTIWIAAALMEQRGGTSRAASGATGAVAGGPAGVGGAGGGGHVHSFDELGPIEAGPWRDAHMPSGRPEFIHRNLIDAGLSRFVSLYAGKTAETLPRALPSLSSLNAGAGAKGGCQLAFIDADHSVNGVWSEFLAVEPYLDIGGYVVFHDTFPEQCAQDGPRALLDTLSTRAAGRYDQLDVYLSPLNFGMTVIQRVG